MTKLSGRQGPRQPAVRTLLMWIGAIPFVLVAVAGFLLYFLWAEPLIRDEYAAQITGALDLRAFVVERWVEDRLDAINLLSRSPSARRWDLDAMLVDAAAFVTSISEFSAAVFVDVDGNAVVDSASGTGGNIADRDYFQRAVAGQKAVSEVIIGRSSGNRLLIFALPVLQDDGSVVGIVFAPVQLGTLDRLVADLPPSESVRTSLIDGEGNVIAASSDTSDPAAIIPDVGPRVYGSRGSRYLGAGRRVAGTNWLILAEARLSELGGVLNRFVSTVVLFAAATLALLTIAVVLISRQIERPVRRLDAMSREVGVGDYEAALAIEMPSRTPHELARLYEAMRGMVEMVHDRQSVLQRDALTDPLTSVSNRRHLESEGRRIVTMCAMSQLPCSILVVDADHFKRINDRHGHNVGDEALVGIARSLHRSLRAGDFLARYGGEEFVAILPGARCPDASILAERVRSSIADHESLVPVVGWRVTVSIGISEIAVPTMEEISEAPHTALARLEAAIAEADRNLYEAKRGGRNRASGPCS